MRKIFLLPVLILGLLLASCSGEQKILTGHTFALDTLIELKIYAYPNMGRDSLIQDSFDRIKSLENLLSKHVAGSDIDNLNKNAGMQPVNVSDVTYRVLHDSLYFSRLTSGLFDVTAGPLIDLWAIDPPDGHYPSKEELGAVLPLIDYQKIAFLGDDQIALQDKDMAISLGAIAKGTIADEMKAYLLSRGVTSALINLGGNVLAVGLKPDGSSFVIGIQDPDSPRGVYLLSLQIEDESVVSSGDYERYFEYEGNIYHHILNPKTGFPAQTNIKQVTIVTANSQTADGLSTSVLLLGVQKGIQLIESLEGVEAIFITKDHYIYFTSGLHGRFDAQEDLIQNYTITDRPTDLKN
ncbi:MAG: FAD:protein FMN transferase [Eubacteriales bacterium]|jgi:thiamine biosynthesis lipoprotein|nr:FAD:protein FMN transferase [Eubacteriales bacterium]